MKVSRRGRMGELARPFERRQLRLVELFMHRGWGCWALDTTPSGLERGCQLDAGTGLDWTGLDWTGCELVSYGGRGSDLRYRGVGL